MTLGCAQRSEVRSGSRPCENSDVELSRRMFVSITLNKKRTTLAGAVKRRKERKQFCAFSARGRFHTAWVIRRHRPMIEQRPLHLQERTWESEYEPDTQRRGYSLLFGGRSSAASRNHLRTVSTSSGTPARSRSPAISVVLSLRTALGS